MRFLDLSISMAILETLDIPTVGVAVAVAAVLAVVAYRSFTSKSRGLSPFSL